jgi:hypothetical protein
MSGIYGGSGSQILLHSAVPIGIAPSGTMANNGAVTLGTALDITYSGGLYLYLPASAISAGSAAGFYYCVMSSTTVGTVYNNTYTSGQPTIPASPTAFATTGPGAYTGDTSARDTFNMTVPGNLLGSNGGLRITFGGNNNNSAGNKNYTAKYGGTTFFQNTSTTNTSFNAQFSIYNRGVTNVQTAPAGINSGQSYGAGSAAPQPGAINTTADQTVTLQVSHGTATDWVIAQAILIEFLP